MKETLTCPRGVVNERLPDVDRRLPDNIDSVLPRDEQGR